MDGLSADKLRVLLYPYDENEDAGDDADAFGAEDFDVADVDESGEASGGDNLKDIILGPKRGNTGTGSGSGGSGMDFRESVVLASLHDSTRGEWKGAQVLYSYPGTHKVHTKRSHTRVLFEFCFNWSLENPRIALLKLRNI